MASYQPWPDPVTDPVSPGITCRTSMFLSMQRLSKYSSDQSNTSTCYLTFHLHLPSNHSQLEGKLIDDSFPVLPQAGVNHLDGFSTLFIKQDVPAHMQMSNNTKQAGSNLHSNSQAYCIETKKKISTAE